ncbi:ATP-binding cassette domain-containing protein, partial [Streptococcus pyogenes]
MPSDFPPGQAGIHARFRVDYPEFSLDVDLRLPGRGVTALFGQSGSGKTTCLRCMAGQQQIDIEGELG